MILLSDFADDDLVALARQTAIDHRVRFTDTTVTSGEPGFRQSKVLWHHEFPELYDRFVAGLREVPLREHFAVPPSLTYEAQLTAHRDGDYFKRHIDNGCSQTAPRLLSYVWYFDLTDERKFKGGQLRLEHPAWDEPMLVEPTHNSLVVFPSSWWHEVLRVAVPTRDWHHGRYTLNGWAS